MSHVQKVGNIVQSLITRADKRSTYGRKVLRYATRPRDYFARRNFVPYLPNGHAAELRELEHSGYVSAEGINDRGLLSQLQPLVDEKVRNADSIGRGKSKKDFWHNLLTAEDFKEDSLWGQYVLQAEVIGIVSRYLGQLPFLVQLELVVSHGSENQKWKISQNWHKDFNDSRMCKLFTYFSDVSEEDGPFTFIPADRSKRVKHRRFPTHKTDDEMKALGWDGEAVKVQGAALSSFLIDTYRCFHCGSRMNANRSRVAMIATYATAFNFGKYDNQFTLSSGSEITRMVLRDR